VEATTLSEWREYRVRRVGIVTGCVVRDEHVIRIVASVKEQTNERLVITACESGGADLAQIKDRRQQT